MPQFQMDQEVTWESGANIGWARKTGKVVAVIPPGMSFRAIHERLCKQHECASAWGGGLSRKEESYAVLVPGNGRKPTLYWPRTSALKAA